MRRLVVASAILAAFLTGPFSQVAASPQVSPAVATDSDRATAALAYLLAAQKPDGSIDGSLGETADFVIGTAAAGFDPATLHGCSAGTGALEFLAAASDAAAADPAKTGKAVLAVVAAGGNPSSFAGRDLIARLGAAYHAAPGAYGDGSTFGQSFAILGLKAAGRSVPAAAITELKALQDPDGSWSYGTAPVAAGQGDTNSTAIALMALDAAGDHAADATGLAFLASQQLADGGFPYQNSSTWGQPVSDPDSDAIVLQAIVAAGENPEAADWTKGSATVMTHLRSAQAAGGGFAYPGMAANAFTTSQIPAALMRVPYGAPVHPTKGRSLPATACPSPTASPSSKPTATPTVAATSTPKPSPKPTAKLTAKLTARPTARPTAVPTPDPTPSPAVEPTATPSPTATATATASPTPIVEIAGATATTPPAPGNDAGSSDGASPLLYGAAALMALIVVAGGGWVLLARPRTR